MSSRAPISRILARRRLASDGEDTPEQVFMETAAQSLQRLIPTSASFLCQSEFDLMDSLPSASYGECGKFLDVIAQAVAPRPLSALEALKMSAFVKTGVAELDDALRGGLRVGQLNELVGRSGVGKSQWCQTISARMCALEKKGVVYLDAERKFDPVRFSEIIKGMGGDVEDAAKVTVIEASEMTFAQISVQLRELQSMLFTENVGLVVFDSIAAIARGENLPVMERQSLLSKQASELKTLAETFGLPVLVTNQVKSSGGKSSSSAAHSDIVAALGNTWHHVVNVRLFLYEEDNQRLARVEKSPHSVETTVPFVITSRGVLSVQDAAIQAELDELNKIVGGVNGSTKFSIVDEEMDDFGGVPISHLELTAATSSSFGSGAVVTSSLFGSATASQSQVKEWNDLLMNLSPEELEKMSAV